MHGLVRHFSFGSRIKPPAQAFTQNGYELQKSTHLCAHVDSQRHRQYLLQL